VCEPVRDHRGVHDQRIGDDVELQLLQLRDHRIGERLLQQRVHDDEGFLMTIHQHTFRAIGCTNSVLTTDATTIDEAARVTEAVVEELDLAASRFQAESEISRINGAASGECVDVVVSELLGGCITASLHAADTSRQPSPRPTSTST
jgi:hypothetical protein